MPDNQQVNVYRFGIEYHNRYFCWIKKELYSMPYHKNNRCYSKKKLSLYKKGNSMGYKLAGDFKSMKVIKELTKIINYKEELYLYKNSPF